MKPEQRSISSIHFELSAGLAKYLRSSDPMTHLLYARHGRHGRGGRRVTFFQAEAGLVSYFSIPVPSLTNSKKLASQVNSCN